MDFSIFYIFILVVVLVVAAIISLAKDGAADSSKKKDAPVESVELKVRITDTEHEKTKVPRVTGQESLDSVYAKKNHLWICSRCETINSGEMDKCAACGKRRS